MQILRLLLVLSIASAVHAQTTAVWFKVAAEGQTVNLPAGATVRYGVTADNKWDSNVTYAVATSIMVNKTALVRGIPNWPQACARTL